MVILMEEAVLDSDYGYGEWGNAAEVVKMRKLSFREQKAHVKKLWLEDPKSYYEWKEDCICLIFLVLVIILFLLMNPNYNFFIYLDLRT